ncbi:hypothetical protein ND748_11555 [Frankia sp. AiPs1]|uniref:hypothetical protein n=1 Tax=Frankia sp. AiPs1 TaxID=573493 RepID=UPI002043F9B1|nr:hypothetical protein [Frankia sp. AiPs1]MCM3922290.1 hypothetical protein [Frankia sp. AiPs1]
MPDSSALDVLIGLALLFAAFSLAVSRINEAVLGLVRYRGRRLESELRRLLGGRPPGGAPPDPGDPPPVDVAAELLDGPLRAMRTAGRDEASVDMADHRPVQRTWAAVRRARRLRLPSYVPSTAFARALLDRVDPPARAMLTQLRPDGLPSHIPAETREAYRSAYEAARHSLDEASARALYAAMPADHPTGRVVAAALVSAVGSGTVGTLEDGLAALPPSLAKDALTAAVVQTGGDREKIITELARWYDEAMDRLSGWYKRRIAVFLLAYAIVLVAVFNLDAVAVSRALWQDGTVRDAAVTASQSQIGQPADGGSAAGSGDTGSGDTGSGDTGSGDTGSGDSQGAAQPGDQGTGGTSDAGVGDAVESAIRSVRDASGLALPIGWVRTSDDRDDPREVPHTVGGWLLKIAGLAIACFALTAGAPFWFELLGRLVNMRAAGPKPRSATSG